jgi:concanavalin A-like lectin/glucanase superfamily protein
VRLDRAGSTFSAFISPDGQTWQQAGDAVTVAMADPVLIGLAVTSHNVDVAGSAEFSNVSTTGNVTGNWQMAEIGATQPAGNGPETVYMAVEDNSGNVAVVTHPDAAVRSGWTEWIIPFGDLAGVNLNSVRTMYIGVGDRNNPTSGGAGTIFVDDILVGHPGSSDPGSSGLMAYYALENDPNDGSGNGHDGTVMGEPVYIDGPEGYGSALQFDGVGGQYVDLGTPNLSAATGRLSVSFWANWDGLSGQYQGLVAKRDTWSADDMMWQIEANRDTGTLSFARNGSAPASGSPILPIGEWAHVAATFNGTSATFYFNAEATGQGDFSFGFDPEAALVFGACQGNGGNPFNGALDEVRIYDRALSTFEVKHLAGQ